MQLLPGFRLWGLRLKCKYNESEHNKTEYEQKIFLIMLEIQYRTINEFILLIKLRIDSLTAGSAATAPKLTGTAHKPELNKPAIGPWRSSTSPLPVNRRIPRAILDNPGRIIIFVPIMIKLEVTGEFNGVA